MPRRNRRERIPTLDDMLEDRRERERERHEAHVREAPNKWEAQRRREDNRVRGILFCIWPDCDRTALRFPYPIRPVPLCSEHAYRVNASISADSQISMWASIDADREMERRQVLTDRAAVNTEAASQSRQQQPGWIYYVRIGDRIKIGFTIEMERRMREYPPNAELLAKHPGTLELETQIHRSFRGDLQEGREWYQPSDRIMAHIATVIEQYGEPARTKQPKPAERRPVTYPHKWRGGRSA